MSQKCRLNLQEMAQELDAIYSKTLGQGNSKSHETSPLLKSNPSPTYKYCSPAEWRSMYRGSDSSIPLVPGTFPFFLLPAELRNEIYRELLTTTVPLQLVHDRPSWPDTNSPGKKIHPTILQASKQVCNEGLSILYGENTWYLHIDNSLVKYKAEMLRRDPGFRLPPPLTTCMPRIKRLVMHAGYIDRTRTKYEIYRQLLNLGIAMEKLQLFAIQFPDEYLLKKNKRVNVGWLEEIDVKMLKAKYVWFPDGTLSDEGWLVMKQDPACVANIGQIP